MRAYKMWMTLLGLTLVMGGCNGGNDAPPAAGGGDGPATGSADSFTNSVAQAAASPNENQEPSNELAQLAATTPETGEPAAI